MAAKLRALLSGRFNIGFDDVRRAYYPSLRHRVLLNFEAQAEAITADAILKQVAEEVPEKA